MTRTTRAGLLLAIAGGQLAVAPAFAEAYTLPKLFFLALGAAVAWAGLAGRGARSTGLDRPVAALWLAMLAATAVSVDPAASALGMHPQQFYGLLPLALVAALYYAAAAAGAEGEEPVADAFILLAAALAAFAVAQRAAGRPILTGEPLPEGYRVTSTIGNPVMLGGCLAFLLPFVLRGALGPRPRVPRALLPLVVVGLALTWARGAWASAELACGLYLVFDGRVRVDARRARALGLACAVAAAPAYLLLQRRLAKGDSDSMRVEMLKAAPPMLAERPWLGWGPDTYMIPFRRHKTDRWVKVSHATFVLQLSAHDDLLQAAVTLGLPGLAAYLWLLAAAAAAFRRRLSAPDAGFAAAAAAGLAGLFLQAKVNPVTPSTLALAAIATGLALRRAPAAPRPAGRAAAAAAALALAAATALLVRLGRADLLFKRGLDRVNAAKGVDAGFMAGVGDIKRATELNPWSLNYLSQRCELIFRVSRVTPPEQGKQLIDKTLELTAAALRLHPGNPTAHELRSTALTLAARFGADTMREAFAEIKTASAMDPTLTFSLRRRMDLARALNDREEFERAKADYLRVIVLTNEVPDWNPIVL
ncbi:MAG: O-antigen ligase family protein [Elusimicrobia bacterium]|nr:O-antigen ligase family protein [Elusimicrobiota bacterium]